MAEQKDKDVVSKLQITSEDIPVTGRLVSISAENVIADASQLWDSTALDNQENINQKVQETLDQIKDNLGDEEVRAKEQESIITDTIQKQIDVLIQQMSNNNQSRSNDIQIIGSRLSGVENSISQEISTRESSDNNIQSSIDSHKNSDFATTSKYGHVRLAESLDDTNASDVVTMGILIPWMEQINRKLNS